MGKLDFVDPPTSKKLVRREEGMTERSLVIPRVEWQGGGIRLSQQCLVDLIDLC